MTPTAEPLTLEVGTPIWSNGFGCITWMGENVVGVALLSNGEPSIRGSVPLGAAASWVERWIQVQAEDGRIETIVG